MHHSCSFSPGRTTASPHSRAESGPDDAATGVAACATPRSYAVRTAHLSATFRATRPFRPRHSPRATSRSAGARPDSPRSTWPATSESPSRNWGGIHHPPRHKLTRTGGACSAFGSNSRRPGPDNTRPLRGPLGLEDAPTRFLDPSWARALATTVCESGECEAVLVPSVAFLDQPERWNLVIFADRLWQAIEASVIHPTQVGSVVLESTARSAAG